MNEINRDSHGHYRKGNDTYGDCECCNSTEIRITVHYGNMWMCDSCWSKESALVSENQSPAKQAERLSNIRQTPLTVINREINDSIEVRADIFNANTVAIINLKTSIDNSDIVNKPYALAEELLKNFEQQKKVIFEHTEAIVEANNKMKAIQVYLNGMANQLRQEEREKLKIADINYKPTVVKLTKPKSITTTGIKKTSGRIDKVELRKAAAELGIGEFLIQSIVVSKGITVAQAVIMLKKSINEAKSASINSTNEVK